MRSVRRLGEGGAMPLTVVAPHAAIVTAINTFNAGYHRDYSLVKGLSAPYMRAPTVANAAPLATELRAVLYRWGAGKQKAPNVQPVPTLQTVLLDPNFHALLAGFSAAPISTMSILGGHTRVVGGASTTAIRLAFDTNLIATLSTISAGMLINNTNVTYPMKVLLLLTGFMPALDSQVRNGLFSAGLTGTNATQFLMPAGLGSVEAKKLTRLPFILGDCFASNAAVLTHAATASHYPWLATEPGRLFDVLLFMQGSAAHPLFAFTPRVRNWYGLA